jgi:NhaP-type Na+/H+ or K+/H+ antiporter
MHEFPLILFLAVLTFAYGLISKLSERIPITGPMVFVAVGMAIGPAGLGLIEYHLDDELIRIIAEITLVSILFVDASTISLRGLLHDQAIPARLLLIGLPLTMLLGTLVAAWFFPGLPLAMLALMAFILSPTDAALGQAVVSSKDVPENIRREINVESGLNDGLVLPPILMCIGALGVAASQKSGAYWLDYTISQLVIGPIAGAIVGFCGGWLVDFASKKNLMLPTFQRLSAMALAVMAWGLAEQFHGNGYIAAFFAGLLLFTRTQSVRNRIQEYGEAEGQQLALMIFLIFGAVLVPQAMHHWDMASLLYALLSLTLIRMLPVYLSLLGSNLNSRARLFIGWFGPRGVASILYLEMVIMDLGIAGLERVLSVIVLTVLLSVFLHGLSALPISRTYR